MSRYEGMPISTQYAATNLDVSPSDPISFQVSGEFGLWNFHSGSLRGRPRGRRQDGAATHISSSLCVGESSKWIFLYFVNIFILKPLL